MTDISALAEDARERGMPRSRANDSAEDPLVVHSSTSRGRERYHRLEDGEPACGRNLANPKIRAKSEAERRHRTPCQHPACYGETPTDSDRTELRHRLLEMEPDDLFDEDETEDDLAADGGTVSPKYLAKVESPRGDPEALVDAYEDADLEHHRLSRLEHLSEEDELRVAIGDSDAGVELYRWLDDVSKNGETRDLRDAADQIGRRVFEEVSRDTVIMREVRR